MKHVISYLTLVYLSVLVMGSAAIAETSCECPKLGCDPCSFQESIKFYTEKCGPEDSRVKSCARPRCIPIDQATAECPVVPQAGSGPREPIVMKVADIPKEEPPGDPAGSIGKVKVIQGSVSIVHADGKKTEVTKESDLKEGETVESAADGTALVNFNGGNKLHVHSSTAVEIKEFKDQQAEASRKTLLHLIKGKIRNQVEQKYNGKTSYYRIETKTAVAGVRGTDFVIEQMEGKVETRLETLRGKVNFSTGDEKESREITRGEGAFVSEGKLSPIYKIEDSKLKELERDSRVDVVRTKSRKDAAICEGPRGLFNQCAWRCSANPAGERKCRTDLPKVGCLRQRCNGNGIWADETHLSPAAGALACPGTGVLVKDCDY